MRDSTRESLSLPGEVLCEVIMVSAFAVVSQSTVSGWFESTQLTVEPVLALLGCWLGLRVLGQLWGTLECSVSKVQD